jgi:SAM-dependent methyltransferase
VIQSFCRPSYTKTAVIFEECIFIRLYIFYKMPNNPAATKWNPEFDDKPTSEVPRIRFSQKFSIKYLESKNRILEIGCGIGSYTRIIDNIGCIALDLDLNAIKIARRYCTKSSFIVASVLNLPFREEIFDLICMWGVLEEIPNGTEVKTIIEIKRVLGTNCVLLLSLYNDHFLSKIFDPAYIFRGVRHYNLKRFITLLSDCGLLINDYTVRGRLNTLISIFLVYFYKHILKKKDGKIKKYFDLNSAKELDSGEGGIVYMFIAAKKKK